MNTTTTPDTPGLRRRGLVAGLMAVLVAAVALAGCDFLDPTDVENPRTTDEDLARAGEPTAAMLPGLRSQFARTIASVSVITEVVSDNYSIHGTGLDKQLDDPGTVIPDLVNSTTSVTGVYWNPQELRALADFVLDEIVPGDETATAAQRAEIHYYRGMAFLIQGENFSRVPVEEDGEPLPAPDLLQRAVQDLETAIGQDPGGPFALRAQAALARAYRLLGNPGQASQAASSALAADPDFLFQQTFDASSVQNGPHIFLVVRALKEMQPLPRLDFLDPKYLDREAGIAVAKAEEMHLILAEAALAQGSLAEGRGHLVDAIRKARARGTESFVDDDERRNDDLSVRPRDSEILVRASPESPFREGLILDRPGSPIPVPTVSGTSLDADSVASLTDADEVWHAFHLARQEIMLLEARRMSDLGIRLPMMLREVDSNPTVQEGEPGTVTVVPAYIPPDDQMDLFDPKSPYADPDGTQLVEDRITIRHDLNRILTENRVSPFN